MLKTLIPTRNDRGGIARYIDALTATFPTAVTCLPTEGMSYLGMVRAFRRAKQVWTHHVLPVGTAAWLSRVPYVVFLHGLDFDLARRSAWKRWLAARILRRARAVVTNSQALAKEVADFAGIALPRVTYPFVSDALVEQAREVPQKQSHVQITLLTVARLVERKGHCKVLQAMRELPNTVYDIVGDGPMRAAIVEEVRRLGLEHRVHLHGEVPDEALASYYRKADIFVMPTSKTAEDREGFGIVYLEANLFGLPVVAVQSPGVDEAVIDGRTGVLINDTPDALVDALLQLHDPALRAQLGAAGRERVLTSFTRETQCMGFADLL